MQADLVRVRTGDYRFRRLTRADLALGVAAAAPLPTLYLINWLVH